MECIVVCFWGLFGDVFLPTMVLRREFKQCVAAQGSGCRCHLYSVTDAALVEAWAQGFFFWSSIRPFVGWGSGVGRGV